MAAAPSSLLLIRLSSMGDVLLTTPLLRILRASYPTIRLDVVVDERFAETLLYNPHYSTLLVYKRSTGTVSPLKTNDYHHSHHHHVNQQQNQQQHIVSSGLLPAYDAVIDLQRNRHSRRIRRMTTATKAVMLHKHRWQKLSAVRLPYEFYRRLVNINALGTIAERYCQTALHVLPELHDDGKGLEFWLPEERLPLDKNHDSPVAAYPPEHHQRSPQVHCFANTVRIAIAPGAHHATKRWLPERFAEAAWMLAQTLAQIADQIIVETLDQQLTVEPTTVEIVLLGGRADVEQCTCVEQTLHSLQRTHNKSKQVNQCSLITIRNASNASSLNETARELSAAAILLCNDTGVMHLAAARHTPIVAVFGSTVQDFGFAPYRTPSVVVEAPRTGARAVSCRPCTHIGRASCPRGHFRCMNDISSEHVANAAWNLLCSLDNHLIER